jgi:hypothetical protein
VLSALVGLHAQYGPGRVTLILGNRDVVKVRLLVVSLSSYFSSCAVALRFQTDCSSYFTPRLRGVFRRLQLLAPFACVTSQMRLKYELASSSLARAPHGTKRGRGIELYY